MKPTENYEQLTERFTKRIKQLGEEQSKLDDSYDKWVKLNEQLSYLQGCLDTVQYLMKGELPNDGNHDGMKNHQPTNNA